MSTYSNHLYDHFQRERSVFGRAVLAVLSMGVFFALVFQPYLATIEDLVDMDVNLTKQAKQIKEGQKNIRVATNAIERAREFMGDASEYEALYKETRSWVNDLDEIKLLYDRQSRKVASLRGTLSSENQASWHRGKKPSNEIVKELRKQRPNLMADYDLRDDCFFRLETEWVRCQIDTSLGPIRDRLSRVLYDRTESHELTRKLASAIEENREKYVAGLAMALGRGEPAKWVRNYLDTESAIIRRWYKNVARERLALMRDAKEQKKLMAQNEEQWESLQSRKKTIRQSGKLDIPIGSLPLAFLDTLILLPLLLFVIGYMLLRSQTRLLALYYGFQRQGPAEETGSEALQLTMAMWLDPAVGRRTGTAVLILMSTPGMVALAGIAQLVTSSGLNMGGLQLFFTIAGTLVAAIFYAAQYVKLCLAWRQRGQYLKT